MMISDCWNFILSIEQTYENFKKKIMNKFSLTSAEVDVLMFLANNEEYDTAIQIAKIKKMPKSHVSLAVKTLINKNYLKGVYLNNNNKNIHLKIEESALRIIEYGKKTQEEFTKLLFLNFTDNEKEIFLKLHKKIANNIKINGDN